MHNFNAEAVEQSIAPSICSHSSGFLGFAARAAISATIVGMFALGGYCWKNPS